MLVTGNPPNEPGGHLYHRRRSSSSAPVGGSGGGGSMGFLRGLPPPQHHHKVPSPISESSLGERFSNIIDNCQKKIKLLQAPSNLFNNFVTKARRKERECTPAQEQEHKLYLEEAVLERKIPETDLQKLVELPPGLGYEEWLASHTIDFFQHINLLYGTVCEYCTLSGCPDMTGPATRQYLWFDEKGKKTRVAAPQYVDYVMTFTQKTIGDETIFPTKFENDFPTSFESIVKKIHRLLFHVLAHLYHSHFREMVLLNLHAHLNCIFAHFILFNQRFILIDDKETEILHDLVVALKLAPESEDSTTTANDSTSTLLTTTNTETNTSTTLTTSSCSQQLGGEDNIVASPITSDTSTVACAASQLSGHCGSDSITPGQESLPVCTAESGIGDSLGVETPSSGAAMDTGVVAGPPDTRP